MFALGRKISNDWPEYEFTYWLLRCERVIDTYIVFSEYLIFVYTFFYYVSDEDIIITSALVKLLFS